MRGTCVFWIWIVTHRSIDRSIDRFRAPTTVISCLVAVRFARLGFAPFSPTRNRCPSFSRSSFFHHILVQQPQPRLLFQSKPHRAFKQMRAKRESRKPPVPMQPRSPQKRPAGANSKVCVN